jgi:hypothetical protein
VFNAGDVRKAVELHTTGMTITEVAEAVGRKRTTISSWIHKYNDGALKLNDDGGIWWGKEYYPPNVIDPPPVPGIEPEEQDTGPELQDTGPEPHWAQERDEFAQRAARSPAVAEQIGEPDRPDVTPLWKGEGVADLWAKAEEQNEVAVNKAITRSKFEVDLGNDPVGISFVSDQHISVSNSVCLRKMREDAELIAESPGLYACVGGDGVDNHVKHRSALLAAKSTPGEQWLLYEYYLGLFAHKIIAMISGNHDAWTKGFAGLDMVHWIAEKNRICYAPAEAHLDVTVGGYEYLVSFRHQYRMNSSFNETHAVKQWLRHGDTPFDVGCVCHHHTPALEEGLVMGEHRIFCRPGSYQITSAHSRQYGYNITTPTCPTVIFYPGERKLMGFYSVRDAAKWLRMELGK